MKDKWINVGYESDELKPHTEPAEDFTDTSRIGENLAQPVAETLPVSALSSDRVLQFCLF